MKHDLKSPFMYRGGKSLVADEVHRRFGRLSTYIEPFAGSLAVLLASSGPLARREIVNDFDTLIINFWRTLRQDPQAMLKYVAYPPIQADVKSWAPWLQDRAQVIQKAIRDGECDYVDIEAAGRWMWFINHNVRGSALKGASLYTHSQGIQRMELEDAERLLAGIQQRLRHVVVYNGDWTRVLTDRLLYKQPPTGIFLDPPYLTSTGRCIVYTHDSGTIANDVRAWAIEHGDDERLRIALCGWEEEHADQMPNDWATYRWRATGSKGGVNECVWFSPHCRNEGFRDWL